MRAATYNPKGFLILFLLVIMAAMVSVMMVQLSLHPWEKRQERASVVAGMFKGGGQCDQGPSAELYSMRTDRYLYICFLEKGRVAIWILTKPIVDFASREITAIPPEDISKPLKYLTSIVARDGLVILQTFGAVPQWFMNLFGAGS